MTDGQLAAWFIYHPPTNETLPKYTALRLAEEEAAAVFAHAVEGNVKGVTILPAASRQDLFNAVNETSKAFAKLIDELAPQCADTTVAVRAVRLAKMYCNEAIMQNETSGCPMHRAAREQLRQARFWANAAIACGGV